MDASCTPRLSGDVSLRLEVFPEGRTSVAESIRIVSTEAPPPVRAAAPAPPPAIKSESPAAARKKKPSTRPAAQITHPRSSHSGCKHECPAASPQRELRPRSSCSAPRANGRRGSYAWVEHPVDDHASDAHVKPHRQGPAGNLTMPVGGAPAESTTERDDRRAVEPVARAPCAWSE